MTIRESTWSSRRLLGVFTEHAALTRAVMEEYLEEQIERPYLGSMVAEYPRRGGRMLGPALCLTAVRACGGRLEDALGSAAALELIHNAMLIHYDIADEGALRRQAATLLHQEGLPLAINTGDALTLLSLRPLLHCRLRLGPRLSIGVLEELQCIFLETARSWSLELGWRRDGVLDPGEETYLTMALGKTSWPLAVGPLRIGALIAGRFQIDPDCFRRFGFLWGAAFQIHEEVAHLRDGAGDGRGLAEDLWSGCRTLPLLRLGARATPSERVRLAAIMELPRDARAAEDIAWIRERMDVYDCLDSALVTMRALAGAALYEAEQLAAALPAPREAELLADLAMWVGTG